MNLSIRNIDSNNSLEISLLVPKHLDISTEHLSLLVPRHLDISTEHISLLVPRY